jgi:hypothetical protein
MKTRFRIILAVTVLTLLHRSVSGDSVAEDTPTKEAPVALILDMISAPNENSRITVSISQEVVPDPRIKFGLPAPSVARIQFSSDGSLVRMDTFKKHGSDTLGEPTQQLAVSKEGFVYRGQMASDSPFLLTIDTLPRMISKVTSRGSDLLFSPHYFTACGVFVPHKLGDFDLKKRIGSIPRNLSQLPSTTCKSREGIIIDGVACKQLELVDNQKRTRYNFFVDSITGAILRWEERDMDGLLEILHTSHGYFQLHPQLPLLPSSTESRFYVWGPHLVPSQDPVVVVRATLERASPIADDNLFSLNYTGTPGVYVSDSATELSTLSKDGTVTYRMPASKDRLTQVVKEQIANQETPFRREDGGQLRHAFVYVNVLLLVLLAVYLTVIRKR